ncbi:MAG: hypothetical protein QOJ57_2263, partial [Thermoleophilaceae bacterium]|nr:hypothetical protein [Thermoleophilaceae bacterium]
MSEMRFVRAQDRQLSLWQSAVSENIRGRLGINAAPATTVQVTMDPMMEAVHQHVETALVGNPPTAPAPDSNDDSEVLPYLSRLGFELGQALAEEDAERAAAIEAEARKYSDQDPGFLTCATTYAAYYAAYGGVFAYSDWRKEGGGNINYGVIDWRLPNDARVGIIGDWGTGLDDAKELLRDLIHQHKPAALIHLGDIYYSATPTECQVNYADVITQVFDEELGEGNRIPVFTLAGNHDYYALGYDFYRTFGTMNSDIPGADQVASYFCLRSADGGWQFVAMDTGYYDS